jgi:HSP20 family molecular chaperone IbpA
MFRMTYLSDRLAESFEPIAADISNSFGLSKIHTWLKSPMLIFPRINIIESGDYYILNTQLPGINLNDIEILVQGRSVVLRGEKKADPLLANAIGHVRERAVGIFHRRFELPGKVLSGRTDAHYHNGVLVITLMKETGSEVEK